eukprot:TRINITY_DN1884_c0_g1_i1.p1 TRINITY_DN1884_c0_g1~~TRINITY_DN1884_c0_g1_i1.p1  ORF type:complete len:140 (+),score=10.21 TRINITY_DN1884_c0_g1_i1:369-788(+)
MGGGSGCEQTEGPPLAHVRGQLRPLTPPAKQGMGMGGCLSLPIWESGDGHGQLRWLCSQPSLTRNTHAERKLQHPRYGGGYIGVLAARGAKPLARAASFSRQASHAERKLSGLQILTILKRIYQPIIQFGFLEEAHFQE